MPLNPLPGGVRLKTPASSGSAYSFTNQYVKVQAIDTNLNIAHVVTQHKVNMQVSLKQILGKGVGLPAVGETWLITSLFGVWTFAVQVNPSFTDADNFVLNTDSRLSDARTPTGTAGGVLTGTYPNPGLLKPTQIFIGTSGEPAFQNSWANYGTPYLNACFYKDNSQVVHLAGMIKSGVVGDTAFTLPSGYLPGGQLSYSTIAGNGISRIDVLTSGNVQIINVGQGATGSNGYVSLSGITFLAMA